MPGLNVHVHLIPKQSEYILLYGHPQQLKNMVGIIFELNQILSSTTLTFENACDLIELMLNL